MKKKGKKPAPAPTPRPYIAALFCAMLLGASPVFAQKAGTQEECIGFADMGIVAAALAKAEVKEPVMRNIIADIYSPTLTANAAMVNGIIKSAYASKAAPKDFATALGRHCIKHGGDVGGFFGTAL